MPETKHYVYSAHTTEEGLALINKARGSMGWDSFVNEAVCAHYGRPRSRQPAAVQVPH